jgi:hypothetical protein
MAGWLERSEACQMYGWRLVRENRFIDTAVLDRQYRAQKLVQLEGALMLRLRTKFQY